ncbi:MAG: Gfo/Idh/MocA family oxidoreductase [Prevotellaceae bacterium]|nr:Gfo/Idh/MocA family oxidoreductase [Prevotellaceae bacterium]
MSLRIALIGLGRRGLKTLQRYASVPGAEICLLCDTDPQTVPTDYAHLPFIADWREACRADVDLVYICTPWDTHCAMACHAMEAGRHAAVEVPAATTVEECHRLVETSRRTGRQLLMTENCCYDLFHLETLEMVRAGLLGELTHLEGAYIHPLENGEAEWMQQSYLSHGGNPYPTHAFGPVCQLLGDDRPARLVSLTGKNGINTTLVRTEGGVSIMLALDVATPGRPYSRLQTVCGTRGFVQKYPVPCVRVEGEWNRRAPLIELWHEGHRLGVPNEMNYVMDCRMVEALTTGRRPDIDVTDAALWSSIAPLSRQSALLGGQPVDIPDFRRPR